MSVRDEIRVVLGEGRRRTDAHLAEAIGKPLQVIRMQLGMMRAAGEVAFGDGAWGLTGQPPAPVERKRRARVVEAAPPPEPVAFDAGVFLDGSIVLQGAEVRDDGVVVLQPHQVERLLALLQRFAPQREGAPT